MAPKKKEPKKAPAKMVWRIFKFFDRFEYTHDAFKKKPLYFTKSFVGSGFDAISAGYFKQIQDLKLYPDYLMLKGMFDDIRDISANAEVTYRGYLLDGGQCPASSKLIGSWVGLDARSANAALKKIQRAGLIELVELPDFDSMEDPTPPKPPEKPKTKKQIAAEKRKAKAEAAKAKKAAADAAKAEKLEDAENREKSGKNSDPLKNGKNGKTANGKAEGETASGKTANVKGVIKAAKGKKEPQPDHHPAADAAKGQTNVPTLKTGPQGAADGVEVNEQPSPLLPTQADGPHSGDTAACTGSSESTQADGGDMSSAEPDGSDGIPPQHHEPTFEQKYDRRCQSFAVSIYQAIGFRHPIGSPEAYREMATFATQWQYAQGSAIGDVQLGILWGKAVEEGKSIGRKIRRSKGPRKPGAVWVTIFKSRLSGMAAKRGTAAKAPQTAQG